MEKDENKKTLEHAESIEELEKGEIETSKELEEAASLCVDTEEEIQKKTREICDWIVDNSDCIYIREQIDGKWGSYSLTELPVKLALKHATGFIKKGIKPHRLVK